MGYSISVNCRSAKLHARMKAFLKENFRPWPVVATGEDGVRYIGDPTDDLSYARRKLQIGFNYGAWGEMGSPEYEYYWAALRWMALQAGCRRTKIRLTDHDRTFSFPEPVPYTVYDGLDHWPVLLRRPEKALTWCWVDKLGMHRDKEVVASHNTAMVYEKLMSFPPKRKGAKGSRRASVDPRVAEVLGHRPAFIDMGGFIIPSISLEDRQKLVKELLWEEIEGKMAPVRAEMSRLDSLWARA